MLRNPFPLSLKPLARSALRASGSGRLNAYRRQQRVCLSACAVNNRLKAQPSPEPKPKPAFSKHDERDLIYEVLSTVPSQREARHFLRRFVNSQEGEVKKNQRPKEYVESLLSREKANFLGLIKIQPPFTEGLFDTVAPTLVHLKRLGLMPIVLLDHDLEEVEPSVQQGELEKLDHRKRRALQEALKLVDAIEHAGGRSRVLDDQVFFLSQRGQTRSSADAPSDIMLNPNDQEDYVTAQLKGVFKSLEIGQIPVIVPIGTTDTSISKPVKSDPAMIALSQALGRMQSVEMDSHTSVKLMIINQDGGIPSPQHHGAIGFINLKDEYSEIMANLQTDSTNPSRRHVTTLTMIKQSLENLPVDSSAIIVPAKSSRLLISNWIRDKPLYSAGQPKSQQAQVNSSVIRRGFEVKIYRGLEGLDIEKLNNLLELAFAKPLDKSGFWKRVETCLSSVIVAGDYQGAAIVTNEHQTHPYLDKFAVDPKKQGGGIADILWKKLTSAYPELTWRSRKDNGVNKWYFERSDGNVRIPDTNWVLFWYGRNGIDNLDEYYKIAKEIPPSFHSMKHK
ncbi:DUF619-domain-containing protein [Basidiobolus meristosporus CBS 931.73]|uniref:Amino-acid acetyltransferase, mitochondrial n=1 Tax=Basidiobolus meristosporus CBS 931.73 TaxID=1314790 RepID=A0A1Y1YM96_9FUNG|nr:DUF619-domain-containing protein [Basidiobolus meristosporus CBS 931.73]|eukprot:ORX99108.1 DUF619-domain-containing protein [Basidiobolus meristosporus CBS 931.73]